MKNMRLFVLLLPIALASAQVSDLFDKAPPQGDDALRARLNIFYAAHVSGKFREAFKVVADDAQDDFLAASKDQYGACAISKINYSENFTKATATTACKGEYRWHGSHMPVTIPLLSTWKVVDGQWYWYHIKATQVETPWGISRETPENSGGPAKMPSIPADPQAAARDILSKVAIDKNLVELKGYETSKGEVHITNNMPGGVSITVDRLPYPGLTAKIDKPDLGQGGKATIVFAYDPNDPSILCGSCTSKAALPTLTANVRVMPIAQVYPVTLTFAVDPEIQKLLPKLTPAAK